MDAVLLTLFLWYAIFPNNFGKHLGEVLKVADSIRKDGRTDRV